MYYVLPLLCTIDTICQDAISKHPLVKTITQIARDACIDYTLTNCANCTRAMRGEIRQMSLSIWMALLGPGDQHGRHIHEGNLCSGVFYAAVPPGSSPLYLSDPRGMPRHHDDYPQARAPP